MQTERGIENESKKIYPQGNTCPRGGNALISKVLSI
jgi:hypothetical protein